MSDDVRRWSEELARDPASLVFLQLGETLRRQGQLDIALRIAARGLERHPRNADAHDLVARIAVDRGELASAAAEWETVLRLDPTHVGALKGIGFVRFQEGRHADAEGYLTQAAALAGAGEVQAALEHVRRSSAPAKVVEDDYEPVALADPRRLFADLLLDDGQTALLLDAQGCVLGGMYVDADGVDVGQEIGAHLSGISDEVRRAMRRLDIGEWRSIVFESQVAVVAMSPAAEDGVLVVAAAKTTPLGSLKRLMERCLGRAASWLSETSRAPEGNT